MGFLSSKIMDCFPDLNEDLLMRTLFEMNRFYDMNLKNYFSDYKKKFGITLDSFQRKVLRNYYYYGNKEVLEDLKIEEFPEIEFNELDIEKINSLTIEKLKLPTKDKIVKSIYSRVDEFNKFNKEKIKAKKWLDMRKVKTSYSFVALNIDQDFLDKNRNYEQNIYGLVNYVYESLENYRYCAVVINEKLKKDGIDISWNLLSKIAIYMENFIQFKKDFFPFKRKKKIEELTSFLENNRNLRKTDFEKIVSDFYTNISTGFVFTDLLLSDNQETKILIMRKIELDESPVLCPSCLEKTGRGNSYPMMFLKSWECQNPNCPERSKSGRGKRYDEYGIYRYFKLVENDSKNVISRDLYSKWRRDIFDNSLDIFKMLYMYYTWNGEKVLVINRLTDSSDYNGRKVEYRNIEKIELKPSVDYSELPIVKLFRLILQNYLPSQQKNKIESEMSILNEDSISGLAKLCKNQIKYAITSPPYYNAREYSQWPTLLAYLVDMMLDAKSVFDAMDDDGVYLYNVGDIVDNDNVYVSSQMSKRRIMLGFYSAFIFDVVGYKLCGNKIWDKGEVESKRNSTVNLNSGYVKYVNCYEHVLVFYKRSRMNDNDNKVYKIKPVYKINSKGQNILGHTAPYPSKLVDLIKDYIEDEKYLLDPFLGSGTTGMWAKKNNVNFVGFELNEIYYRLSKERIESVGGVQLCIKNFQ